MYLVYRVVIWFYFLVWLVAVGVNASSPRFLIYLTQWSFIALNVYLLSAVISTAINFFTVYVHPRKKRVESPPSEEEEKEFRRSRQRNCCKSSWDQTTVCDKVTWGLFNIAVESAFMVTLLYWVLVGSNSEADRPEISPVLNIHLHILNGAVALLEVWLTGIPVHLLHFIYPLLFCGSYTAFTGVYYAVNGTGHTGERFIYSAILDYDSHPGTALGTLAVGLVAILLIHIFFHLQYLLRNWITGRIQNRFKSYRKYFDPIDMSAPIELT